MENNIKHFEDLWNECEKISSKKYASLNDSEILNELTSSIASYEKALSTDLPAELRNEFIKRLIGHMTFIITALSAKENVNVYSVLNDEMNLIDNELFDIKHS